MKSCVRFLPLVFNRILCTKKCVFFGPTPIKNASQIFDVLIHQRSVGVHGTYAGNPVNTLYTNPKIAASSISPPYQKSIRRSTVQRSLRQEHIRTIRQNLRRLLQPLQGTRTSQSLQDKLFQIALFPSLHWRFLLGKWSRKWYLRFGKESEQASVIVFSGTFLLLILSTI